MPKKNATPQGKNEDRPDLELGFRGTYHDLLGDESGHLTNREIVTFDLRLRLRNDAFVFTEFNLLSIQNLGGNPSGIPGDRELSWRFRTGFERTNLK